MSPAPSPVKRTTITLLRRPGEILLAMKKRGFGEGKWNGAGGKLEKDETPLRAAIRETEEEIGVTPEEITPAAVNTFYFKDDETGEFILHTTTTIYWVTKWSGTVKESEEMAPRWFKLENIPYADMWESDTIWLPQLLEGRTLEGSFYYDSDSTLLRYDVRESTLMDPVIVSDSILHALDRSGADYLLFEHEPALTYEQLENAQKECGFTGTESKCMVLKTDEGFVVYDTLQGTRLDLKALRTSLGTRTLRLATADELREHFGAEPGCAYPFGFRCEVPIMVDTALFDQEWVLFSPARSDRTVQVRGTDLRKVFESQPNPSSFVSA